MNKVFKISNATQQLSVKRKAAIAKPPIVKAKLKNINGILFAAHQ